MLVEEVMTPRVATIDTDSTLAQAAKVMRDDDVGWLPVLADGKVVGVVSDRDLVVRAVSEGRGPDSVKVSQVMSSGPICCRGSQTLEEAEQLMKEKKVRRLLVVDVDGRPAGALSVGDLAARLEDRERAGDVLGRICQAG
jgi:CBS domain-containing protein